MDELGGQSPQPATLEDKVEKVRRQSETNFEHWDGQYIALVQKFNELAAAMKEWTEDYEVQVVEVHTHEDDSEGGPDVSPVTDHTTDDTDAHDATAISIVDSGTFFSGSEVEAALQELATAAAAHLADTADAHDASAISILDSANDFTATDVEGALAELQSDAEAHIAASDPHAGYRLESADHTHQSTGAQAGTLDHGLALTGLTDDDHTQYMLESVIDAVGDIVVGSADNTIARLPKGTDGQILSTDSGETLDLKWIDPPAGGSIAIEEEDVEVEGSATVLDFDGDDFVLTDEGSGEVRIALAAPAAGVTVQEEDSNVVTGLATLDFAGADFNISDEGSGEARIVVSASPALHVAAADPHPGYILESLFDAAGDLIIASAADTPARLARGSDDTFLRSTGSTIAWEAIPFSIVVFLDGVGTTLATGRRPIWNAAFPCTVTAVKAYADTGTTTVVNAGTTAAAGAEEFCSADITIDPADAWESGTVDQNQAITAGETVCVEVITAGTATQLTIQIDLTRP